jgi:hypothetical protein
MSAAIGTAGESHVCFGCQQQIRSGQPHIHAGLDAACDSLGLGAAPLGLDDLLSFAWCRNCTQDGGPFEIDAHEVKPDAG